MGRRAFYHIGPTDRTVAAKFTGYSRSEVNTELKTRKETLDRMCSLELLAAMEARLRIDYLVRAEERKRDDLSRRFREIYGEKAHRASLANDILPAWRKLCPEHKTRLDNLHKAIDYRNWLAHGRYWFPKNHPHIRQYDYLMIARLTEDILTHMELAGS